MYKAAYKKIQLVYARLETDPVYSALQSQLHRQEAQFKQLMAQLPQAQQDILIEYIGLLSEAYQRITEIACYTKK